MTPPDRTSRTGEAGNPAGPDDSSLLVRAREGDEEAFRCLVERYQGAVAATVIGMLGPGGEADDVGQEVFVRFYRALDRFRGDSSLKTYLTRIAINLSLNEIKRRRRWLDRFRSRDREPEEAPLPEPAVSGERELGSSEIQAAVHAAIEQLAAEHRSVVVLRMIQGHSTRETAEILGLPQGTVMSRLSRAMKALQPLLVGYAGAPDE